MPGVIAVHVGAGSHSSTLYPKYKELIKRSCKKAMLVLKAGGSALDAVCVATQELEESELTNAGKGSSMTMEGGVECDASAMDGTSLLWGAIGAVSGIRNPVVVAKRVLQAQKTPLLGGLVPPSLLVGSGAQAWAKEQGLETCCQEDLITEKSRHVHTDSLRQIEWLKQHGAKKMRRVSPDDEGEIQALLDTVGAVCVDSLGNVASAVSSGGLLLKHSGRVGQAAMFGCGCWAEQCCSGSNVNMAVSTSGCGEQLIRTMFARTCAEMAVAQDPLGTNIIEGVRNSFLESKFLCDEQSKMAGALVLRFEPDTHAVDLYWLHTTRTMGIGFMSVDDKCAQAIFSQLPPEMVGKSVSLQFKLITCKDRQECDETRTTLENVSH